MSTILGIESTAHTFGVGVVKNKRILSNVKRVFTTEKGGMIPMEVAKFHCENKNDIYFESLNVSGITEKEIDAIAFSQGPGLAPCLLEGMKFAKELSKRLNKPIVPVNHCVAHLEIGSLIGAYRGCNPKHFSKKCLLGPKNPVMLYVSGANTQIIAYDSGKYRIFGETLDIGAGNFIDTFGRYANIGFPAGAIIEKLAKQSNNYIELPYKVKGMDVAFSGILTNLKQKLEKIDSLSLTIDEINNRKNFLSKSNEQFNDDLYSLANSKKSRTEQSNSSINYILADLSYSMQETVFAMLVETAERALAHTGKNELLLGGGVACNRRLQEMCKIMCKERGAKFFCPENSLLVDNGAMIAYLGEIMFRKGIKENNLDKIDIKPRQRTDDINVRWK